MSDYSTYATTYSSTPVDSGAIAAAFITMIIVTLIISLICYVVFSFILSRIFKKAGIKQSIAWIPIYNSWKLLEMGDQKGFWAILALVPVVNIASAIFMYIAMYHIGKKFGKEDWFVAIAILLPPVWMIWLAFDKSVWQGSNTTVIATTPPAFVPATDNNGQNNTMPFTNQVIEPAQPPTEQPSVPQPFQPVAPQNSYQPAETTEPSTPINTPVQPDTYNQLEDTSSTAPAENSTQQ